MPKSASKTKERRESLSEKRSRPQSEDVQPALKRRKSKTEKAGGGSDDTKNNKSNADKDKAKPAATTPKKKRNPKDNSRLVWSRKTPKSSRSKTPKSRIVTKTGPIRVDNVFKFEEDQGPRWPARALGFKTWADDEAFDHVRKTLVERGWKDLGNLCNPTNLKELQDIIRCQKGFTLPRRCLWWVHEDDGRRLKGLPEEDMASARHCISTFMGTDAAVTKVAVTEMNDMEDYYPKSFVLPSQMKQMKQAMKKQRHWIAKPRNDYAGRGIVVYEKDQKEFRELINSKEGSELVVQTYISNPLLIGGYKFHFRMYTILTGVGDNFEAWLYKDGHGLFSTKPFSNNNDSLGNNFDILNHLTNWSINYVPGNPHLKENKPVIGVGCEWSVGNVLKLIKKDRPEFDAAKFWKDMTRVCAKTMYKIAQWKNVKKHMKMNNAHPRFENFGLDVLMDDNFKIWLMEGNTEVGLNPSMENFPEEGCDKECVTRNQKNGCRFCRGGKNIRNKQNNRVITDVINLSLDLMELDCDKGTALKNNKAIPLHSHPDVKALMEESKSK